jgi:hypothetical protein
MAATTYDEARLLAWIEAATDPKALRQLAQNAASTSSNVERAALRRLAHIAPQHAPGTVPHACWSMVHAVEELRRRAGRKVWRMNRMRRKIEKDGEVAALEYCALRETEGFSEVLAYGVPELTAEAIVIRHSDAFSKEAVAAARERLAQAGVVVE